MNPKIQENNPEYLALGGNACVDAEGRWYEIYHNIGLKKDIFRIDDTLDYKVRFDGSSDCAVLRTLYDAAAYCEEKGTFLPSFALSCNLLVTLYEIVTEKRHIYGSNVNEAEELLDKYRREYHFETSRSASTSVAHVQNTLINYETQKIIHYPQDRHFNKYWRGKKINKTRQTISLPFSKSKYKKKIMKDMSLEDALKDPSMLYFLRQLTGLKNPEELVNVARYLCGPHYTTEILFPGEESQYTTDMVTPVIGFFPNSFCFLNLRTSYSGAIRAVQRVQSEGRFGQIYTPQELKLFGGTIFIGYHQSPHKPIGITNGEFTLDEINKARRLEKIIPDAVGVYFNISSPPFVNISLEPLDKDGNTIRDPRIVDNTLKLVPTQYSTNFPFRRS